MQMTNVFKTLAVVSLLSVLVACGGGGEGGAVDIPDVSTGLDTTPPKIITQMPDSSSSVDVVISMTFDEDIAQASITNETIQVFGPGGLEPGTVSYNASLKQLSFSPDSILMAFTPYQVVFSGISDSSGNVIEQTQDWVFTTIFDQLPPELPEF